MDVRINVCTLVCPSHPKNVFLRSVKKKKQKTKPVEFGSLFLHVERRSSTVRRSRVSICNDLVLMDLVLCDDLLQG